MDFNTITVEQEKAAVAKFKEYGVGINMSKFTGDTFTSDSAAKWADLISPEKYSPRIIKQKALDVARIINTNCNDEVFGKPEVAFNVTTDREERIEFTWTEVYTFLRAAYRYQSETAAFKERKAKIAELEKFIGANKSRKQQLIEAQDQLKSLKEING